MRVEIAKFIIKTVIVWMSTILATKCMEKIKSNKIYKDLADYGYKFNLEKLINEEQNEEIVEVAKKENTLKNILLNSYPLIPFLNMYQIMQDTIDYNQKKEETFRALKNKDYIEDMTEREKREYAKNKTVKNFKKITRDTYNRIKNSNELYFDDDGSTFYYDVTPDCNDIEVLKVTGPASRLSEEEQKNIVKEFWEECIFEIINTYGSLENFEAYTKENQGKEIKISTPVNNDEEIKPQKIEPMIQPNQNKPKTKEKTK